MLEFQPLSSYLHKSTSSRPTIESGQIIYLALQVRLLPILGLNDVRAKALGVV